MNLARYYLGKNGRPFYPNQCIPCNGPLVIGWDTKLNYLLAVAAQEYNSIIPLPGGECTLVHLVGVAEEEIKPSFDLENPVHGIQALYRMLCKQGIGSCSIPERQPLTDSPDFLKQWQAEVKAIEAEKKG